MRILVYGSTGRLGRAIFALENKYGCELIAGKARIQEHVDVVAEAMKTNAQVILNCAAITDTSMDADMKTMVETNVYGVKSLTSACRDLNIKLAHISTDYALRVTPNNLKDQSPYVKSKVIADSIIRDYNIQHTIIYTSFFDDELLDKITESSGTFKTPREHISKIAPRVLIAALLLDGDSYVGNWVDMPSIYETVLKYKTVLRNDDITFNCGDKIFFDEKAALYSEAVFTLNDLDLPEF